MKRKYFSIFSKNCVVFPSDFFQIELRSPEPGLRNRMELSRILFKIKLEDPAVRKKNRSIHWNRTGSVLIERAVIFCSFDIRVDVIDRLSGCITDPTCERHPDPPPCPELYSFMDFELNNGIWTLDFHQIKYLISFYHWYTRYYQIKNALIGYRKVRFNFIFIKLTLSQMASILYKRRHVKVIWPLQAVYCINVSFYVIDNFVI